MSGVPLVDLDRWRSGSPAEQVALAAEVDEALRTYGFLLVAGTGIDPSQPVGVRAAAAAFFALPREAKAAYETRVGGRGWLPPGVEANSYAAGVEAPPDLKETFTVARPSADPDAPPNVWPAEVPAFRDAVEAYQEATWTLAWELFELFAVALGLERDAFTRHVEGGRANLNINRYPSLSETGPPEPGQFRIAAHTDFGVLTVLDRQPGYGALQIETLEGEWIDAPHVPGALTINVGDLLARWTGDRWRSTSHRVLPPDPRDADEALTSLVNFFSVRADTSIETLPVGGPTTYEPIRAGDHLQAQLAAISVGDAAP